MPDLHACGLTGEGVVVGLLDTGFSTAHQAFSHLVVQAEHGTKVLSLLAGLDPYNYAGAAPYVAVVLAKIDNLAVDDPAESDWWVAGLEWIEGQGADVASGSIGFCSTCPPERMDGQTEPTTIAAGIAVENGLIVVNSAGNRGPDPMTLNAPADAPTSDYGWGRIRGRGSVQRRHRQRLRRRRPRMRDRGLRVPEHAGRVRVAPVGLFRAYRPARKRRFM